MSVDWAGDVILAIVSPESLLEPKGAHHAHLHAQELWEVESSISISKYAKLWEERFSCVCRGICNTQSQSVQVEIFNHETGVSDLHLGFFTGLGLVGCRSP